MRSRGLLFALLTIAVFGASQLIATGATTRAGKFRYAERDFNVGGKAQSGELVAKCPSGTHVYGGGPVSLFDTATLNAGYPVDGGDAGRVPDDGWAMFYDNYETFPIDITLRAVCGQTMPRYRSQAFVVRPDRAVTRTVACPRGSFAWGGGASNRGPFDTIYLSQTAPAGARRWKVTLSSIDRNRSYRAVAFAVCGPRRPAYVSKSKAVGRKQSGVIQVRCPSQRFHIVAPGFSAASAGAFDIQGLYPDHRGDGDGAPDDMGTADVTNYASRRLSAKVHAVCLR